MAIAFKAGVEITSERGGGLLAPPAVVWRAIERCHDIYLREGTTDGLMWVTSICEGYHTRWSHHYRGHAFDLRTRNLRGGYQGAAAKRVYEQIKVALGPDWQVILEDDHIHCGFKPARIPRPIWT